MLDNIIDFINGSIIASLAYFLGGFDALVKVLLIMIVIDYISGVSAAYLNHELSSNIGLKGIVRKCMMIAFVGVAHLIDTIIPDDGGAFRSIVCLLYIANEGTSLIENAIKLGVPIPEALAKHFRNITSDNK